MADHGGVLLLSVHAAVGAGRHDAAAVRGVRPQRDGRGVDGRALLLRLFAVQPRRRRGDGSARAAAGRPVGAAAVGVGALLFATGQQRRRRASAGCCRAPAACSRWSAPSTSRPRTFPASRAATLIGATQMFGMAGGSAGQFVVGPVIARRRAVEHVLDRHGRRRAGDQRAALRPAADAQQPRRAAATDWLQRRGRRAWARCSAIRSRSCAA